MSRQQIKAEILKAVRDWKQPRSGWQAFLKGWDYRYKEALKIRELVRENLDAVVELIFENPHDDKLYVDLCHLVGHGGSAKKEDNPYLVPVIAKLREHKHELSEYIVHNLSWRLKVHGY
jgi:hypothetical protein